MEGSGSPCHLALNRMGRGGGEWGGHQPAAVLRNVEAPRRAQGHPFDQQKAPNFLQVRDVKIVGLRPCQVHAQEWGRAQFPKILGDAVKSNC